MIARPAAGRLVINSAEASAAAAAANLSAFFKLSLLEHPTRSRGELAARVSLASSAASPPAEADALANQVTESIDRQIANTSRHFLPINESSKLKSQSLAHSP